MMHKIVVGNSNLSSGTWFDKGSEKIDGSDKLFSLMCKFINHLSVIFMITFFFILLEICFAFLFNG